MPGRTSRWISPGRELLGVSTPTRPLFSVTGVPAGTTVLNFTMKDLNAPWTISAQNRGGKTFAIAPVTKKFPPVWASRESAG